MFADLTPLSWAGLTLLATAAVIVGFAKTAVGGLGMVSVAVFAAVLPSRASTGAILPLLIVGDLWAVSAYRAHVDWRTLARLLPAVALGVGLGVVFVSRVDDQVMRRTIGAVILALLALQLATMRRPTAPTEPTRPTEPTEPTEPTGPTGPTGAPDRNPGPTGAPSAPEPAGASRPHTVASWGYGSLSGFTTMVANAGGPAMSLYLLSRRFPVLHFLGTTSWFFFVINLFKVPFSVGLGLITRTSLLLDLALAPAVLIGAYLGRRAISHIRQDVFDRLVLASTLLAGLNLLR